MKKLIMGLAAAALAGSLQAASLAWGMKNDGAKTFAGAQVYMVLAADYSTAIDTLNKGGSDVATKMSALNTGDAVMTATGKGAVTGGAKSDASASDGAYYWIAVMANGATIADGMTYYATGSISYSTLNDAGAIAEGAATPTAYLLVDSGVNRFTGTSGTVGAPEPTSGLLLLLGVAGLALKRKRA